MTESTQIKNLRENVEEEIDTSEMTDIEIVFDMDISIEKRLSALEAYAENHDVIEITNRLNSMYLFSGTKLLREFLKKIALASKLSATIRVNSAMSLCYQTPSEETYEILSKTLGLITDLPVPCEVESVIYLMNSEPHQKKARKYFVDIVNRQTVECDFRYKTILGLENFPGKEYFIKEAQWSFSKNIKNFTSYRILSCQYLLQKCKVSDYISRKVQTIISGFMYDDELDYNLRADAADVLMRLGSDTNSQAAREIILLLGRSGGAVKSVFDNSENVHHEEIEESASEILEFLSTVRQQEGITFEGIKKDITETFEEGLTDDEKDLLEISFNRIQMDRALYGKFNATLHNILIMVWNYVIIHQHVDELKKRVLEELLDMSGKCSTGYAFRLANVISGFGDFNIRISYEDQIAGNLSGRLNRHIQQIEDPDYQSCVLSEMTMLTDGDIHKRPNFLKFFREHLGNIRHEIWEEFKEDITDTDFDMYFRKAVQKYEGYGGSF